MRLKSNEIDFFCVSRKGFSNFLLDASNLIFIPPPPPKKKKKLLNIKLQNIIKRDRKDQKTTNRRKKYNPWIILNGKDRFGEY